MIRSLLPVVPLSRRCITFPTALLLVLMLSLPAAADGLKVVDGGFERDGQAYRGIGVNYYDAFLRTLRDGSDTSYDAGFATLADKGIPFARFNAGGFWPDDLALYQTDKAEYLRRLDGVVASAERHGVGLIPSLFWNHYSFADLVDEPAGAWADPNSQTRQLARQYTTDLVTRYRDSPAILMWEFGNEMNLVQDLPNQNPDASISVNRGTPAERTAADKLSSDAVRDAVREFATLVRGLDPDRAITTGHSVARNTAFHLRREGTFTNDASFQFRAVTAADHLDPSPDAGVNNTLIDTLSVHAYYHSLLGNNRDQQTDPSKRFADFSTGYAGVLAELIKVSENTGKPLFIGEFGVADAFDFDVPSDGNPDNTDEERLRFLLDAYTAAEVPLAALWVYDFKNPSGDIQRLGWNVTADNDRAYQLDLIAEYNARWQVPEPAAGAVLIGGIVVVAVRRRRSTV